MCERNPELKRSLISTLGEDALKRSYPVVEELPFRIEEKHIPPLPTWNATTPDGAPIMIPQLQEPPNIPAPPPIAQILLAASPADAVRGKSPGAAKVPASPALRHSLPPSFVPTLEEAAAVRHCFHDLEICIGRYRESRALLFEAFLSRNPEYPVVLSALPFAAAEQILFATVQYASRDLILNDLEEPFETTTLGKLVCCLAEKWAVAEVRRAREARRESAAARARQRGEWRNSEGNPSAGGASREAAPAGGAKGFERSEGVPKKTPGVGGPLSVEPQRGEVLWQEAKEVEGTPSGAKEVEGTPSGAKEVEFEETLSGAKEFPGRAREIRLPFTYISGEPGNLHLSSKRLLQLGPITAEEKELINSKLADFFALADAVLGAVMTSRTVFECVYLGRDLAEQKYRDRRIFSWRPLPNEWDWTTIYSPPSSRPRFTIARPCRPHDPNVPVLEGPDSGHIAQWIIRRFEDYCADVKRISGQDPTLAEVRAAGKTPSLRSEPLQTQGLYLPVAHVEVFLLPTQESISHLEPLSMIWSYADLRTLPLGLVIRDVKVHKGVIRRQYQFLPALSRRASPDED